MRDSAHKLVLAGCVCAALAGVAACSPKPIPPMTVEDLMDDRVALDGVLMKCNQNPAKARNDSDCRNARVAVERLARDVDPATEAKRTAEFEHSREQLRLAQERVRQAEEARAHVDPYSMPVVPVEPAPPPAASNGPPPAASQPKP